MKMTGMMWGLCIAMGLSTVSLAGSKSSFPVYVNTVSRNFTGNMGAVRNSADTTQYLYCYSNYSTTSGYAYCVATNAAGTSASCMTTNANLVEVIRSVGTDSYVNISYDSAGTCTSVLVGTGSHHEPKAP